MAKQCTHLPGSHESHDAPANNVRHKFSQVLKEKKTKELKRGYTRPGDCISADHYISAVTGRLPHTYGREQQGYQAGTLFIYHSSGKVFNVYQFSTGAAETVERKHTLEHFAQDKGFKIKSYHSDNCIFSSDKFTSDYEKLDQKISYSGFGAQHQNGVA